MDSACVYEEKTVIHELTKGLQMAEQLRVNLYSPEARDYFIQMILSSYNNALFALQAGVGQPLTPALPTPRLPGSSISFGSPGSGENVISRKRYFHILIFSLPPLYCVKCTSCKYIPFLFGHRKGSPTWEDEVRICSDNGLEGNTDDGYNWRKYGQKDIQGAKFPRSYYRCSYRNSQNCFATKQVQRKDEDPTEFEIAYKGKHTCNHSTSPSPPPSPKKYEIKPTHHQQLSPPSPGEMLSNLKANLSVKTSDLGGDSDAVSSLFSFPSTSSGFNEDHHQLHFPNYFDDELLQVYSPTFISPVTSESNIFSEWGSSQSLNFLADVDTDFEFSSLF
ncbi:putative transcription factor WRKY family [Helianthus debilis subsp. tardiflorus]